MAPLLPEGRMRVTWLTLMGLALPAVAQIKVMTPSWLVKDFTNNLGRIDGSTATFGAPFYGDRVLGRLVYAKSKKDELYCTEQDYDVPKPSSFSSSQFQSQKVSLINIVMVRRGKCSFTTKVKVAAKKGAHAVIIVDREDSKMTASDLKMIIVADDGFGGEIKIPSVLITKEDGNKLIGAVVQEEVIVELAWDVPTNHMVVMDLWMSSGSQESLKFLKEFSLRRRKLLNAVIFQPHFAVFGMDPGSRTSASDLCWDATGSLCAEDPDGPGPVTGKMVLEEDVRQLCIHNSHREQRSNIYTKKAGLSHTEFSRKYWMYIEQFMDECPISGTFAKKFGKDCSMSLMKELGINTDKVDACVSANATAYLKNERDHPSWSPRALRINGWRYNGILDSSLVIRAICSAFITIPPGCKDINKARQNAFISVSVGGSSVGYSGLFVWLSAIGGSICCLLLCYKRYLQKEMRSTLREEVMLEVQAQIGEYQKMKS